MTLLAQSTLTCRPSQQPLPIDFSSALLDKCQLGKHPFSKSALKMPTQRLHEFPNGQG
jgi:hypothetical protein